MRARMALAYANITIELREILLSDRPDELYAAFPQRNRSRTSTSRWLSY